MPLAARSSAWAITVSPVENDELIEGDVVVAVALAAPS